MQHAIIVEYMQISEDKIIMDGWGNFEFYISLKDKWTIFHIGMKLRQALQPILVPTEGVEK